MSNDNNPQAPTPAPTQLVAPPAKDQRVPAIDVEVAGNQNAIIAEEQAAAEKFILRGVVFHKEIEIEERNTNIKKAYEGCLYILAERQLQSEKDDKTKGEIFNLLLEKTQLKKSAMYRRKQFAQELIDANVITFKMLLRIEEEEKAWPELKPLLDKRLAAKKGIEIQQKLGYLPSVEQKKVKSVKAGKTLKEKLDEKSALVESLLAEIKKLLEDKELWGEIKNKTVLEGLQAGYVEMESAAMKFKSINCDYSSDFSLPELPQLPQFTSLTPLTQLTPLTPLEHDLSTKSNRLAVVDTKWLATPSDWRNIAKTPEKAQYDLIDNNSNGKSRLT